MNELLQNNDGWDFVGIPKTGFAGIKSLKWIMPDSLEMFEKNNPKHWDEDSLDYVFNSHGYRSVEFVNKSQRDDTFTVASYGCSNTFGVGVNVLDTWPEVFKTKLKTHLQQDVINYNFGEGGASADYVVRVIHSSLPIIKPDLVLVLLPYASRREVYDETGRAVKLLPNLRNKMNHQQNAIYYNNIHNNYEEVNNYLKNIAFIKILFDLHGINHIIAPINNENSNIAKKFYIVKQSTNFMIGSNWKKNGNRARDCSHPGPISYKRLADLFFEKYKELYIDKT